MRSRTLTTLAALTVFASAAHAAPTAAAESIFTAAAAPRTGAVTIVENGLPYLAFGYDDWDAGWGPVTRKQETVEGPQSVSFTYEQTLPKSKASYTVAGEWRQTAPDTFAFNATLAAKDSAPLTMAQVSLTPAATFRAAGAKITHADGSTKSAPVPFGRAPLGDAVTKLSLTDESGRTVTLNFDPPATIHADAQARLILARGEMKAGQSYPLSFTVSLPGGVNFYPGPNSVSSSTASWYEFKGDSPIPATSEWSLASWLEAPAGKHGRILRRDDQLLYNGQPIKLWGINNSFGNAAPEKALADRRADFYAAMGINSVRLHKYAEGSGWAGIQSKDSAAAYDPAALDRMDYFVAALKKRGIYVKLSPVFIIKFGPGDFDAIPYAKELGELSGNRINPRHGSFYISTELQDLLLRQVTTLLKHKNPYTGLTYAEDPAVAYFEIYNEDNALFGGVTSTMARSPTLRARTGKAFADWLKKKYSTEDAFLAAWGPKALNAELLSNQRLPRDESWSEGRIYPAGNPWFFDPENLNGSQAPYKRRLLDTMAFLHELQNEVYARFTAGVRAAGYSGEMVASNWQAGRAMSHYYNLHSDSLLGTIDRHNYFGGGGNFLLGGTSMLSAPGGGYFSASLQQVGNLPFMLSEWIHVAPAPWTVEGPAIIGAYGLGLQGWDVSYPFQNSDPGTFSPVIGRDRWDAVAPPFIGLFPAVSRQVLRGDVTESPVVHVRNVHIPSLDEGKVGFEEKVSQEHDVKTFDSDVFPTAALAAARGVVRFTDRFVPTEKFDLAAYQQDGDIVSATKQLRWRPGAHGQDGHIVINTPGTQAVVGFAKDRQLALADSRLRLESRYGAVYLSARSPRGTLASDRGILVTAISRALNSGSVVADDTFVFSRGTTRNGRLTGPVIMEPVRATIQLTRPGNPTVHLLDHNGVKAGKTLPVTNGTISIDTGRDATPYYLIEY